MSAGRALEEFVFASIEKVVDNNKHDIDTIYYTLSHMALYLILHVAVHQSYSKPVPWLSLGDISSLRSRWMEHFLSEFLFIGGSLMIMYMSFHEHVLIGGNTVQDWLYEQSWDTSTGGKIIACSLMARLLLDFLTDRVQLILVLHHLGTIGSIFFLMTREGYRNEFVWHLNIYYILMEFGSMTYNIYALFPSIGTPIFIVSMTTSNVVGCVWHLLAVYATPTHNHTAPRFAWIFFGICLNYCRQKEMMMNMGWWPKCMGGTGEALEIKESFDLAVDEKGIFSEKKEE